MAQLRDAYAQPGPSPALGVSQLLLRPGPSATLGRVDTGDWSRLGLFLMDFGVSLPGNEINMDIRKKVSRCGTSCGAGEGSGSHRRPWENDPGSIPCSLPFMGDFDDRELGDPSGW